MGISYRVGRSAFAWFYSNIKTAYSKPIGAILSLLWAYFAAVQINIPLIWDSFYAYVLGQICYFIYFGYLNFRYGKGGFFELFEKNEHEKWGVISSIISYPRALFLLFVFIYMPLGLLIFTSINAYLLIGSIVGLFLGGYDGALLSFCIFALLFVWAIISWFEFNKRESELVSKKIKKVGWIGEFQHRFGELLTDEEKKKLEE
ncbi:hypothetical protein HY989_01315 [Candidatus Micrarchaeota archaeon]|nr:hypothetical protein [Candidatus Micrarchaeota archaeon]